MGSSRFLQWGIDQGVRQGEYKIMWIKCQPQFIDVCIESKGKSIRHILLRIYLTSKWQLLIGADLRKISGVASISTPHSVSGVGRYGVLEEGAASPSSPVRKSGLELNLVHFSQKIWHLVTTQMTDIFTAQTCVYNCNVCVCVCVCVYVSVCM